jgi:uncharacterized protein YeaO (DUF488 family)
MEEARDGDHEVRLGKPAAVRLHFSAQDRISAAQRRPQFAPTLLVCAGPSGSLMEVEVRRAYDETMPDSNAGGATHGPVGGGSGRDGAGRDGAAGGHDTKQPVRVLVDRLWPRGIAKASLPLDLWCKGVAPSTELRRWYGHRPEVYEEFRMRYLAELREPARAQLLDELRELGRERPLALLTATRDTAQSHAHVLAELLGDRTPI